VNNYREIAALNPAVLLRQHGLRADKRLGQNFLHDPLVLENIARTAEIQPTDTVLEIGCGLGSLTRYLAISAQDVIAVELDGNLLPILRAVLTPYSNVRLIQADILKFSPSNLIGQENYLVVANIPYYITSAVIRHLLENHPKPRRMVMTVQKEVAERICSGPGDLSLLALSVQVYGKPEIVMRIPAESFYPVPGVDSALLRVHIYPSPLIPLSLLDTFFQLTKAGFHQKRKTLRNSISAGLHIPPSQAEILLGRGGIDPMRRAETLSIDEWRNLCEVTQAR
jgi:16S rRNA (adenine1518-N6/adenine1519-N6)-dimethyltransferase